MAGKKHRKTATPATTKATTAPAGSNITKEDPCIASVDVIQELLACKGTAWLKSPLMQGLLCLLDKVADVVDEQDLEAQFISGPLKVNLLAVSAALAKLVTKPLAAHKRPRDWKQEYSITVASVISASNVILDAPTLQSVPDKRNAKSCC
jgi:hypothetical protein